MLNIAHQWDYDSQRTDICVQKEGPINWIISKLRSSTPIEIKI